MTNKSFIARNKARLFVGLGFVGIFTTILWILTFAKVWSETFVYYGIPPVAVYIGLPIAFLLGAWVLGIFYELSGLQADEITHHNTELNKEFGKACRDIAWVREKMEDERK